MLRAVHCGKRCLDREEKLGYLLKKTPPFPCTKVRVRLSPPFLVLSTLLEGLHGGGHV